MKIVLDTNVLLSNYLFQGYTAEVFDHIWMNHEIILSDWIISEFSEKCVKKFKIPSSTVTEILNHLRQGVQIINPDGKLPTLCTDVDDNNILHVAQYSQSQIIITGDNDLLKLIRFEDTEIISPREYKLRYLL